MIIHIDRSDSGSHVDDLLQKSVLCWVYYTYLLVLVIYSWRPELL